MFALAGSPKAVSRLAIPVLVLVIVVLAALAVRAIAMASAVQAMAAVARLLVQLAVEETPSGEPVAITSCQNRQTEHNQYSTSLT